MQSMWSIYHPSVPEFIREMADTPAMLRLKGIGMHCGCEYAGFPQYIGAKPYSRWVHSVGVALIVWHFTGDMAQTAAGLLHDVASPAFAHTVDFMNGDYIAQESTEDETEAIIAGSTELKALLGRYGLTVGEVCDYHMYPVADNDSPQLSADRLEYTLGNGFGHGQARLDALCGMYDDLFVGQNERGEPEVQFRTASMAEKFARLSLTNSRIYSSDGNRFAMQMLADILHAGLGDGTIERGDLYTTENAVIGKLCVNEALRVRWEQFRRYSAVVRSAERPDDGRVWVKLDAKRRFIDPLVAGAGRVTSLYPGYKASLEGFRSESYDYWMCGTDAK